MNLCGSKFENINQIIKTNVFHDDIILSVNLNITLSLMQQHHKTRKGTLTRKEFQKIVKELIEDASFTGMGAKDILLYIFGVPFTTLLIKQRLVPARARSIPNEYFIPGITSLTVFILAKFHKI